MIPAQHHEELGRSPKPPQAQPTDMPTLTPFKEPACSPPLGSEQGHLLLVLARSCCSTSLNKALPEFLFASYQLLMVKESKNPDR